MNFTMTSFPEWTMDEGRTQLGNMLRDRLGDDADRLRALDLAEVVVANMHDAISFEKMGLPRGPVVQLAAQLGFAADEDHCFLVRTHFPRLVSFSELAGIADLLVPSLKKQIAKMRIAEKSQSSSVDVVSAPVEPPPLAIAQPFNELPA